MTLQPSTQVAPAKATAYLPQSLDLTPADIEIAMDAIAQLIPHLDLQDCLKVIELATAQATLAEVLSDRQAALRAADDAAFAA